MSFNAFSGRTFTTVVAGFALKVTSSLVKGLMPFLAFTAGLLIVEIFISPGRTNANPALVEVPSDDDSQAIKNCSGLLAREAGVGGDLIEDLGLGIPFFNGSLLLGHGVGMNTWSLHVKRLLRSPQGNRT